MYLIIIFIIILILYFKYIDKRDTQKVEKFLKKTDNNRVINNLKKPFIWIYIEETYNSRDWSSFYSRLIKGNTPSYIWLCLYSVYVNCFKDFNIVILNPDNIYHYLPQLNVVMDTESTIKLKKRRQYISFCLLEKYGGVYMEPNIIVLKNLINIYNQLQNVDFIGFPCALEYYKCYGKEINPSTDIMISRKNNILVKLCKNELHKMIFSYNYTSYDFNHYGHCVLQKYLKTSINKFKMKYLQLSPDYTGVTDYNNKIISSDNLLSTNRTIFLSEEKVHVFIINTEELTKKFKYSWFNRFSIDQILASNLWINYLFTKSFKLKQTYYYTPINVCNYSLENCDCKINFGRLQCNDKNNIIQLNEYEQLKEYDIPPKNNINLINMLQNCNYFSTPPWLAVYNSSTMNN